MPNDSNRKAAELHEIASHAHLAAATHCDKQDNASGHEASRQALEHAGKAFAESQEAQRNSAARNPGAEPVGLTPLMLSKFLYEARNRAKYIHKQ